MGFNSTPSTAASSALQEKSTISHETAFPHWNPLSGKFLVIGDVSLMRFFDLFGQQTIKN